MLKRFKGRIFRSRFVTGQLANPVDLDIFKRKPTPRFIMGLMIIGFSYIIGWPLISVLGILAVYFRQPLLFAVGSPVAYAISHLVFILGIFISGKDTVVYMNVFLTWSLNKGLKKIFSAEMIEETEMNDP